MLDLENFQETVASSQDSVIPFPTKTIDQLTPEEQVYFVKVGKDNITKFTDTNLKTFEGCRKDFQNLEPYIYGARRLLDYTGKTILIPVSCGAIHLSNQAFLATFLKSLVKGRWDIRGHPPSNDRR